MHLPSGPGAGKAPHGGPLSASSLLSVPRHSTPTPLPALYRSRPRAQAPPSAPTLHCLPSPSQRAVPADLPTVLRQQKGRAIPSGGAVPSLLPPPNLFLLCQSHPATDILPLCCPHGTPTPGPSHLMKLNLLGSDAHFPPPPPLPQGAPSAHALIPPASLGTTSGSPLSSVPGT